MVNMAVCEADDCGSNPHSCTEESLSHNGQGLGTVCTSHAGVKP